MPAERDRFHPEELPPCGLYRTGSALAESEGEIAAGMLVLFHNHSEEGGPVVHAPTHNVHNRWHFARRAYPVASRRFLEALEPCAREGLYRLREHFHPDRERVVPKNALVQLGYDRAAQPIIFFPSRAEEENAIHFPSRGMKIPKAVYDLLEPLDLRGPREPKPVH